MLHVGDPGRLHFRLLGERTFVCGDSTGIRISAHKGLALLIYLAMNPGRPVSRTVLADLLWSDRGEAQARQNLRQTILTLRRDLGPVYSALLYADDQAISLAADSIDVDVLQFEKWAGDPDPAIRARCLEIQWAPFLDGFRVGSEAFDEWVGTERHRLEAIAVRTYADLAAQLDAAGDGERAILALERLVAVDPGEEGRHRKLLSMELRYRGTDAALARAKSLAAMLRRELDAEPEPATRALVEDIRRQASLSSIPLANARNPVAVPMPEPTADQVAPPDVARTTPEPTVSQRYLTRRTTLAAGLTIFILVGGALTLLPMQIAQFPRVSNATLGKITDLRGTIGPSWQSPPLPSQLAQLTPDRSGGGLVAIAVMPFQHYSEQGDSAKLAAAIITDDVTNLLSAEPVFRVISRSSMNRYGGQRHDAAAIGAELGVRYVLEGNVSIRGDQIRVNVELTETRTRLNVWSGRFERSKIDRYEIQGEIAKGIGQELQIVVARKESVAITPNPDIHQLIFKGWSALGRSSRRGKTALHEAEEIFNKVLAQDPDNQRARNGLALFHTLMVLHKYTADPDSHMAKAKAILQKLIEQYPNVGKTYSTFGLWYTIQNDHPAAMKMLERAISLNPSDAQAYSRLARVLIRIGRPREGLELTRYAMRLSPRDPTMAYWYAHAGYAQLELRQYDNAIASLRRTLAIHRSQPQTMFSLMAALALKGDLTEAHQVLAELQAAYPYLTRDRVLATVRSRHAQSHVLEEGLRRALGTGDSKHP